MTARREEPLERARLALFAYRARAYQYAPETPTDLDEQYADVLGAVDAELAPPALAAPPAATPPEEITSEQARSVVESDAALSIDRMLRRMDEQDKAAFNFCIRQARQPAATPEADCDFCAACPKCGRGAVNPVAPQPAATPPVWIPATKMEFLDLIRADIQAEPAATPPVECSCCGTGIHTSWTHPALVNRNCDHCGHPLAQPTAAPASPPEARPVPAATGACQWQPGDTAYQCAMRGTSPAPRGTPTGGAVLLAFIERWVPELISAVERAALHKVWNSEWYTAMAEEAQKELDALRAPPVASPGRAGEERGDGA